MKSGHESICANHLPWFKPSSSIKCWLLPFLKFRSTKGIRNVILHQVKIFYIEKASTWVLCHESASYSDLHVIKTCLSLRNTLNNTKASHLLRAKNFSVCFVCLNLLYSLEQPCKIASIVILRLYIRKPVYGRWCPLPRLQSNHGRQRLDSNWGFLLTQPVSHCDLTLYNTVSVSLEHITKSSLSHFIDETKWDS